MKVRYILKRLEVIEISTIIEDQTINDPKETYNYRKDKKWIQFCKDHNFNPIKDYNTKIYDLYLRMCYEEMV